MLAETTSLNVSLGLSSLWLTLGIISLFVILLILLLRSGRGYSVKDTESHSTNFAGLIKEGHGGLPAFLWLLISAVLIWSVVYFAMHWNEFAIIFTH
ncbi:MAG: hypothetical protein AABZ77_07545 [Chloroflexota bacterium]